jgi:cystathionine gamma-synthase/methionine-gamma-lyase
MARMQTLAVHAGTRQPVPDYHPVSPPLDQSVAFYYDSMTDLDAVFAGEADGYVYGRYGNPTVTAFEQAVAALEGAPEAVAFSSGMAAMHAALLAGGARSGTRVVCATDIYGASYALLARLFAELAVETTYVDIGDLAAVAAAVQAAQPVAVLCETLSNPLLKVADVAALADLAHANGALLLVDNTFATPYLYRPLEVGADLVVHSVTKYLSGHGDVLAGVVVGSAARAHVMRENQKLLGANLAPQSAWLALRGLRTFWLRVRQQFSGAATVANWLAGQGAIARVNYPGLASHPQHRLAARLFGELGYGGMMSFDLRGAGRAEVFRFMDALRLVFPATTLGDVFSLALYPAHSSHRQVPAEVRAALGITEGLVRLSVGIEDPDDLVADLAQALEASGLAQE